MYYLGHCHDLNMTEVVRHNMKKIIDEIVPNITISYLRNAILQNRIGTVTPDEFCRRVVDSIPPDFVQR